MNIVIPMPIHNNTRDSVIVNDNQVTNIPSTLSRLDDLTETILAISINCSPFPKSYNNISCLSPLHTVNDFRPIRENSVVWSSITFLLIYSFFFR